MLAGLEKFHCTYNIVIENFSLTFSTCADDPNTSQFHAAVLDDMDTSADQWDCLVRILQDQGYEETATNVLSTITVMSAMKTVLYKSLADDRPDSAATQG
jgi:hypothetical protein